MKSVIIIVSLVISSLCITKRTIQNEKEFEGIITYKISVESKMDDVSNQHFKNFMEQQ